MIIKKILLTVFRTFLSGSFSLFLWKLLKLQCGGLFGVVLIERILDITHFFNMNELVFSIVFLDITGCFLNLNELVILIVTSYM